MTQNDVSLSVLGIVARWTLGSIFILMFTSYHSDCTLRTTFLSASTAEVSGASDRYDMVGTI